MGWIAAVLAIVTGALAAALAWLVWRRRREAAAAVERERLLRDGLQALTGPAVIGTLAAAFAHVGNNRLTALAGGLDLLEVAAPANDDSRAALGLAMDATQALANDMSALLAGARWSLEPSVRVGVLAAARRASRLESVLAIDAVPVALDVPARLAVSADPGRFAFALLLLLSLGRRFHAAGVEVAAAELGFDALAGRPNVVRPGRYCRLEVRFDGASLPEPLTRRPLGPGHVVDRLHVLGGPELAAVEAFVLALRGRIEARNTGPVRAVVELLLPLADATV